MDEGRVDEVGPAYCGVRMRVSELVRGSDGGIVGEAAVDFIRQFKVDYAVIGASAIDEDGALLDFDLREVKVAQAIIANARHVILVADSTKFERTAPVRIGHLSQVHTFIRLNLVFRRREPPAMDRHDSHRRASGQWHCYTWAGGLVWRSRCEPAVRS